MNRIALYASLLAGMAIQANADSWRPIASIGYDAGGEKLGTVFFADGTREHVHANQGLHLAGGVAIPLLSGLQLQSTLGFQTAGSSGDNGEMTWQSFPWETTLAAQLGNVTIGGGVIYHLSPEFTTHGALANLGNFRFDDTLGYQAQIAWSPASRSQSGQYQLGVRYSAVEFMLNDATINGDSTGLFLKYLF